MDTILLTPKEIALRENTLFRENNIKSDYENITAGDINYLYIRFLKDNLGIASLAAYLRQKGYSVEVINAYLEDITNDILIDHIVKENPKLVGISLLYDLHVYWACRIVKLLRKKGYMGHITLGGPFITLTYEAFLKGIPEIDSVIRGEGEKILLELLQKVKKGENWESISGIAFCKNNKIITNGAGEYIENISSLPFVARDMYKRLLLKLKEKKIYLKVASIYTSRGCKGKCTYCSAPIMGKLVKEQWRYRDIDSIINEIKYLVETFGVEYINIIDENFFGYGSNGKKRLYEFAEAIINTGIHVKFWTEVRVDIDFDKNLFEMLKKAGLQDILLGLESGSQSVLNRWKKGTTVLQNIKAIEFVRNQGFRLEPSMIMVDPYTNVNEFKETVRFIIKNELCKTMFPLNIFNQLIVFPGTEMEKQLIQDNVILPLEINSIAPITDDGKELYEFCRRVSTRDYEIIDPVIRTLWSVLTYYINSLSVLTDEIIPLFMGKCRVKLNIYKESKKEEVKSQIKRVSRWRRNIGMLAQKLLETSIEHVDDNYENMIQFKDLLSAKFEKDIINYNLEHLDNNINLIEFSNYLKKETMDENK